jgi:plastocyanin
MLAALLLAPALVTGIVQVSITNFAFVPDSVRIQPGDTVRWTNNDGAPHTSTGLGQGAGAWTSGSLSTSQAYQRAFGAAGAFEYKCNFHSSMVATVYVGNATAISPKAAPAPGMDHGAHDAHQRDTRGRAVKPADKPVTGSPVFTPPN